MSESTTSGSKTETAENLSTNDNLGTDLLATKVAIVKTSGRQFLLSEGVEFEVNRIEGEVGETVSLSDVLLISDKGDTKVGQPLVSGAAVKVEIMRHTRGPKLISYKKIRRRGKEWKKGHRQDLTRLKVTSIEA